jgi:hypothetical protein
MNAHSNAVRTILPLLVCAALLLVMPGAASAQRTCSTPPGGEIACTYNGVTFTMEDVRKFAPEVQFHFAERFFPASIDAILANATLKMLDSDVFAPTQQQLADAPADSFLSISVGLRHGWAPAPMYVAVQVAASRQWVDLHYVMLYPYNGPQTYRALRWLTEFNFYAEALGEHEGDLETITVRVTPDFADVLSVRYGSRGDRYFSPAQVTFTRDANDNATQHPIAAVALHSHVPWNPSAYNPQDWEYLTQVEGIGGAIDIIGSALPGRASMYRCCGWRPWEPGSLRLIGLDENGDPVNEEVWAKFAGRLGATQENALDNHAIYGIGLGFLGDPEDLPNADYLYARIMLDSATVVGALFGTTTFEDTGDSYTGKGAYAPGARDWIRPPVRQTVYLRSRVVNSHIAGGFFNLFLTAADSGGATVNSRSAFCTASQLWDVSTWPASNDGKAGWAGVALTNRASGNLLEHTGYRSPVAVTAPAEVSNITGNTVWSIGERESFVVDPNQSPDLADGYAFSAFRPASDTESNLNVFTADDFRADPGTTVGVWDWGVCGYPYLSFPVGFPAGCPNNIWRFESAESCPAPAPPTSTVEIAGYLQNGWYISNPTTVLVTGSASATAIRYRADNNPLASAPGRNLSVPIFGDGEHSFSFGASGIAGILELPMHQVFFKIDSTGPTISATRSPAFGNGFGWNNTPVTVTFTCADASSGIQFCQPAATVSAEGAGWVVFGNALDRVGWHNQATVIGINIDRTPPAVTLAIVPPPNALGWSKTPITVTTHATDALSGINFQTTPTYNFSGEGFFSVFASAVDKAGNFQDLHQFVGVDRTPPVLNAVVTPSPNAAGWNKTPVTVIPSAFDTFSGIDFANQAPPQTVNVDTAGLSVITKAKDRADNESSVTTVVRIDRIPPVVTASVTPSANALGWINAPATVSVVATDALSGIAFVSEPQVVSADADGFSVVGAAKDRADNESSVTTVVRLDQTPPSIAAVVVPSPNAQGWNNTPVIVSVLASDALSGIASTSGPVAVNGDVAGYSVVGTAMDKAGNVSVVGTTINIDHVAPELYLEFDADNDDVALFARDAASGVTPSALTPASAVERCNESDWGGGGHDDDDADDEDESNPCHGQKKGERRTYSVPDNAGNLIEVVVDVLIHHDHVRARFVSIGYNGAVAAPVRRNIAEFKTHGGASKPLDVDQKVRLWFDEFTDHVNAKFEEKKGTTTIKSVRSGQSTNTVRSGRVFLRLATATGLLTIEY